MVLLRLMKKYKYPQEDTEGLLYSLVKNGFYLITQTLRRDPEGSLRGVSFFTPALFGSASIRGGILVGDHDRSPVTSVW